jgi:hypothetical protein
MNYVPPYTEAVLAACKGIRQELGQYVATFKGYPVKQSVSERHDIDTTGAPAGGSTSGPGITIEWQKGPVGRGAGQSEATGALPEGVIQAAIGRLQWLSTTRFKARELSLAITKLEEALHWLQALEDDRERRGISGTNAV